MDKLARKSAFYSPYGAVTIELYLRRRVTQAIVYKLSLNFRAVRFSKTGPAGERGSRGSETTAGEIDYLFRVHLSTFSRN